MRLNALVFSYDITFTNTSAFPGPEETDGITFELGAEVQIGFTSLTGASASQIFEFFGGGDPYFTNRDPFNASQFSWLSQELRVFSIPAGIMPVTGATEFTTDPYASIQSLIGYLNGSSTYTTPSVPDPLNNLPGQQNFETVDSSLNPKDSFGNQLYSFAVARVRLQQSSSASAAKDVRVFFRLWVAQSVWQPNTGPCRSQLGTSGADTNNPVFLQQSDAKLMDPSDNILQTIPFFATDAAEPTTVMAPLRIPTYTISRQHQATQFGLTMAASWMFTLISSPSLVAIITASL